MVNQRLAKLALASLLALGLAGCSFFKKDEAEPVAAEKEDGNAIASKDEKGGKAAKAEKKTAEDERELKIAKLWARVDELEEEQYRQKERVRVLEKGMTLGLIPEELKNPAPKPQKAPKVEAPVVAAPELEPKKPDGKKDEAKDPKDAAPAMSKEETEKYQGMLASAHDQYRSGRYGRAIVEYSEIGKTFGDKIDGGMPLYWIAKSWANLKEYNTARQNLTEFLKSYPSSAWAPRAKLELARVEWQLGLQETALSHFREIIQQHPYEDAAEMAKMELENLDKKL